MRIDAQDVPGPAAHPYELLIPNNAVRRWATYVLNKLKIPKHYVSKQYGLGLGDPNYMARYAGTVTQEQHAALMNTYLPYAPAGVVYRCPTLGQG